MRILVTRSLDLFQRRWHVPQQDNQKNSPRSSARSSHRCCGVCNKFFYKSTRADSGDEEAMKDKFKDFAKESSAPGPKRILIANSNLSRVFWITLLVLLIAVFLFEVTILVIKYRKHEKITTISMKFDNVEFPAITFCNLNPYRKSLVWMVPSLRDTMDVYDNARLQMNSDRKKRSIRGDHHSVAEKKVRQLFEKDIAQKQGDVEDQFDGVETKKRIKKNATFSPRYEAVEAHCKCLGTLEMGCILFRTPPQNNYSICVCTYDHSSMQAHPCFNATVWSDNMCSSCKTEGFCDNTSKGGIRYPCHCRNRTEAEGAVHKPYCLARQSVEIRKLWTDDLNKTFTSTEQLGTTQQSTTTSSATTSTTSTMTTQSSTTSSAAMHTKTATSRPKQSEIVTDPETIKAMGYEGITDSVTMITKATENLMFAVSNFSKDQRIALSQNKHDFIEMCSFDGRECDIEKDFRIHTDPQFGNCFTFNHDENSNYTSKRAGPMYGIRVLLFVNISDYLSTTESAGVRLAIHAPTEYPFPDTFGYSAPVGFVSSFGMKRKEIQRLFKPNGDCIHMDTYNKSDYIYKDYDYHPEGCHRSCFQASLIRSCSCGDPRFPLPESGRHCSAFNATARECLREFISDFGDFHFVAEDLDCDCKQRCDEVAYDVSFSASRLSSGTNGLFHCDDMNETECQSFYDANAAMVEVFFEQLNYDLIQESEAYGFVNLLADFGGHLGLWLGFSVITLIEVVVLLVELIPILLRRRTETTRKD